MAAYLICEVDQIDAEAASTYLPQAAAAISAFGGRYLSRGGETRLVEGEKKPGRIVVIEFPSMDVAMQFYESDAYRAPRDLRRATTKSRLVLADGL